MDDDPFKLREAVPNFFCDVDSDAPDAVHVTGVSELSVNVVAALLPSKCNNVLTDEKLESSEAMLQNAT